MDDTRSNVSDRELLARLDERTRAILVSIESQNSNHNKDIDEIKKLIQGHISKVDKDLDDLKKDLNENFVRKDKFSPIEKVVYGLVGIVLTSVAGALVAMVVSRPG